MVSQHWLSRGAAGCYNFLWPTMLLHSFFDYYAAATPEAEFAVQDDRRLTYSQAVAVANQFANALVGAGLAPGDRFAFLAKNSIEYTLMYYAGSKCGAVPVPLNYRLAPPEWAFIINDSDSKLLIADAEYCQAIDSIRGELPQVRKTISIGNGSLEGWSDFSDWIAGQAVSAPDIEIEDSGDVLQMYTSGTTGKPKGVVLTHRSVTVNISQFAGLCRDEWRGRTLLAAPLYHVAAAAVCWGSVSWGDPLLVHRDFVPSDAVRALSEENVGFALLVPAMIQACLTAVPDVAERRYDGLNGIGYGASPIAEATLRRGMEVFGCGFVQGYGMTESSPVLTLLSAADHRRAVAGEPRLLLSAGRAVAGTDLKIVDGNDSEVPRGQVGEIVARGAQVMKEYWKRPEATAETLRGGWLHTGDAASMDEEGFVYIQDRVKDMIVSGGENIYPREIEDVLFELPAVVDAAVIGVPSEQWGESVKAILVVKAGAALTEDEVLKYCRTKLGGYKVPRSVDFVEALPRNPSGKVLKRELREKYWEGHGRRVAGA